MNQLRRHPAALAAAVTAALAGTCVALTLAAAARPPAPAATTTVTVPGPTVTTSYLVVVTERPGQTPRYYTPPVVDG